MKAYLFIVWALSFTLSSEAHAFGRKPQNPAPAPAPTPTTPPAPTPPNPPAPPPAPTVPVDATCPSVGEFQAVDLANPVTQKFLDVMKQLKVQTVIRYYDHDKLSDPAGKGETLKGKTLLPAETELLARNGFDAMVVFQHNNNSINSFNAARGIADAKRSLALAGQNKQAKGSAIYFGVDGGWSSTTDIGRVKTYFTNAAPKIRAGGYKVGAYGSGLMCRQLLDAKLVDFCWLANATGWPGFATFRDSNEWVMMQKLPRDCGGKNVDFNKVNTAMREIGQFRP